MADGECWLLCDAMMMANKKWFAVCSLSALISMDTAQSIQSISANQTRRDEAKQLKRFHHRIETEATMGEVFHSAAIP